MGEAISGGTGGSGLGKVLGILVLVLLALLLLPALLRGVLTVAPQSQAQPTATVGMPCPTATSAGVAVFTVKLSRAKYPETTAHIDYARTVKGKPVILTVARAGKTKRSNEALAGWPTKAGYERDEYPPAIALEGGKGADIRYIDPSDNAGAGASMGNQLRPQPDGTKFCIELVP
jgi:hypothetical protein